MNSFKCRKIDRISIPLEHENESCRDGSGPEEADLTEPLVTFPDPDTPPPVNDAVTLAGSPSQLSSLNSLNNLHHGMSPPMNIPNMPNLPAGQETMKFEQKKMTSASKTKVRYTACLPRLPFPAISQ